MENELLDNTTQEMEYIGDIPEGWKWVKLGEVAEIKTGKTNSQDADNTGDYPLFDRSIVIKRSKKFLFNTEAVIVPGEGKEFIPRYYNGKFDLHQRAYAIFNFKGCVPKFIYYNILLNKDIFKSFATGSTVLSLRLEHFLGFPILLPPIEEQKAIAYVLSSIDDKIDLLHRQNKTLEEMAMTLFRQWFIEPTKDGLPDGWEEVSLGEIFDIGIGRTPPRKESYWFSLNPKDIRWISVKDLGSIDTYIINTSEFLKEEAVKKFNIPIIPDNTVLLSFKLTVGRIGITIGEMVSNEAIAHFKLKPNSKISSNYLYLFLKTLDFSTFGSTSSIAEAINSKIIKEIKIQIPDDELILSFQRLIDPIFQKIRYNTFQIQTLEKLRDTLLPKLMSGEVNIL